MRGISGITSLINGEADLSALNRTRPKRHGELSSASSVASEESDGHWGHEGARPASRSKGDSAGGRGGAAATTLVRAPDDRGGPRSRLGRRSRPRPGGDAAATLRGGDATRRQRGRDAAATFRSRTGHDEVSSHEVRHIWASSHDARHPPKNAIDRDAKTFWASSGLLPQVLGLRFRRSIQLSKVSAFCRGVRSLRLYWRVGSGWRDQTQTMSRGAPEQSTTEFVFDVARHGVDATDVAKFEIVGAHGPFAVVKHLHFVEHGGEGSAPTSARRRSASDAGQSPLVSPRPSFGSDSPKSPMVSPV